MRRASVWLGCGLGCAVSAAMVAQKPVTVTPAAPPTGTVTGHVTCSDTQRAARFATVSLLAKEQPTYGADGKKKLSSMSMLLAGGRSGLDGSFTMKDVPVGDYYVIGVMPGYVFPVSTVSDEASMDLEKVLADVPLVHVNPNQTVVKDVVLQRGAVLAGRVTYDDGTPAVGFHIKMQAVDGQNPLETGRFQLLMQIGYQTMVSVSDDAGMYRLSGVPPGKYRLLTQLIVEGGGRWTNSAAGHMGSTWDQQWIELYAPGVFHKSEAKVIEVKGGEEDTDLDIKVALDSTHTVSGYVMAKEDRHVPNHVGLRLTEKSDKDFSRYVSADATGGFHFDYVPEGTYTVEARNVEDGAPPADESNPYDYKVLRRYEPLSEDVIVDQQDVIASDMLLEAAKPEAAKTDAVVGP